MQVSATRLSAISNVSRKMVSPLDYFRRGEQGAWYDPSDLSTLFQDAAGTIPVTGVEQPVGLMLDKRLGLALGTEINTTPTNWVTQTGWVNSGGGIYTATAAATSLYKLLNLPVETFYEVSFSVSEGTPGLFRVISRGVVSPPTAAINGRVTVRARLGSGTDGYLYIDRNATAFTGVISSISIRKLPGNHAYQTTTTSRPVLRQDANGKYYLYADGIDDFMVTNAIDFTGTDKMTVIAGVRNISPRNYGLLFETSSSIILNNGVFGMFSPYGPEPNKYQFESCGSMIAEAVATGSPSPITYVMTGISDISLPICALNLNGVRVATSATSQGTGNYGNYPLYLFRRGGTSLPASVYFYGLIIRGAETQEALLNPGQRYMAGKTGIIL